MPLMAAEQKPIEEVEAGDYALSRPEDDADGQLRFMPVTETYTNTTEKVVELWVVNYATGEQDHLTTTPGHPFWTATSSGSTAGGGPGRHSAGRDGGWEFAAVLEPGDTLTNADGEPLTVTATAHQARHEATYNFCVASDHTYHVGTTQTLAHNASINPELLSKPGEDLYVGTYSESYRANVKSGLNSTHTPHHVVQNAVSPVSHGRGVTINIRKDLHEQTATYRRPARSLGNLRQHLAADVKELRGLLRGAGYTRAQSNAALKELIRQNKKNPGFVRPAKPTGKGCQ